MMQPCTVSNDATVHSFKAAASGSLKWEHCVDSVHARAQFRKRHTVRAHVHGIRYVPMYTAYRTCPCTRQIRACTVSKQIRASGSLKWEHCVDSVHAQVRSEMEGWDFNTCTLIPSIRPVRAHVHGIPYVPIHVHGTCPCTRHTVRAHVHGIPYVPMYTAYRTCPCTRDGN